MRFPNDYKIKRSDFTILYYVVLATLLSAFEGMIPKPIPFLRLGLANAVVIWLIIRKDFKLAFLTTLLKTLFSAIVLGRLFTPMFLMGISGAFFSCLLMIIFFQLKIFSIYGISIIGGVIHNLTQLFVLFLLGGFPINNTLIGIAILLGVFMGTLVGTVVKRLAS